MIILNCFFKEANCTSQETISETPSKSMGQHKLEIKNSYLGLSCDFLANQGLGIGIDMGIFLVFHHNTVYKMEMANCPFKIQGSVKFGQFAFTC